ncbi:DUF4129 domain-containing protein [Haladaptatus sp.]|uniref:DUF4129 domain-containing protein n=1 Tax=Haladaptatus sp. TaxID=1973141 RepID=UPI003C50CDE0
MDRNHLRAALIALCVLAVIFGASLFPATGFGSYPAGPGGGSRAGNSGWTGHGGHSTVEAGTTTGQQSNAMTTAAQTTSSDSNGDSNGQSTTTTTTTNAGAGASNHPSAGGGDLLKTILEGIGVALLCLVGFLLAGFRTGTVRVGGGGAIPLVIRGVPIGELFGKIPARTMSLVVGFSASIPRFTDDAFGLLAELGRGLSAGTVGLGSAIAETFSILGRGFGGALLSVGSVGSGLFSIPKVLSRPSFGGSSRKSKRRTTSHETAPPEPEERGPPSIEEAWESMIERLPVRRRRTTTPAEYARVAMNRGYPADAVRQLTDAFREVRYGRFPASGKRTKLARTAIDRIERFREDDE